GARNNAGRLLDRGDAAGAAFVAQDGVLDLHAGAGNAASSEVLERFRLGEALADGQDARRLLELDTLLLDVLQAVADALEVLRQRLDLLHGIGGRLAVLGNLAVDLLNCGFELLLNGLQPGFDQALDFVTHGDFLSWE